MIPLFMLDDVTHHTCIILCTTFTAWESLGYVTLEYYYINSKYWALWNITWREWFIVLILLKFEILILFPCKSKLAGTRVFMTRSLVTLTH
jgi:hypothetical protein